MDANKEYKSTIVFFCMDALGHIHPILPIVKELIKRGHRAIVLTTRQLRNSSEYKARGYEFQSCFEDEPGKKEAELIEESKKTGDEVISGIMKPLVTAFRAGLPDSFSNTYRLEGAAGRNALEMIKNHPIIESKLKSLKPDLIVVDHIIAVPCTAKIAPKWVRIYSGYPLPLYSAIDDRCVGGLGLKVSEMTQEWKNFELQTKKSLRQTLREFWTGYGLEDWPQEVDLSPCSPHLNIHFGIDEIRPDRFFKPLLGNWIRYEHTIDQSLEQVREFHIPDELKDKPGKLIYFSMGTLVTNDYETINRLLEYMSKSPNRFIVSMGQMYKHIKLHSNMWGQKFLDQRAILPKVDLFITHGGHNSIIESFFYGVPGLIVLPVFADQFDLAQQLQDVGLAVRLDTFKCTQEELISSIDCRLNDTKTAERIAAISKRMQSNKHFLSMADELEKLTI